MKLAFNSIDFDRRVADSAALILKNRYFEQNPSLNEDGTTLLSRPGMKKLTTVGEGPIRGLKSEAGSFNGDLFVASGQQLFRMDNQLNAVVAYGGLSDARSVVNMAITGVIGETPAYCFIADGTALYVYMDNGYARNTLSGTPVLGDVINIGGVYYKWSNTLVGTATGSSTTPYLVQMGANPFFSYQSMYYAINASGEGGVDYSAGVVANGQALADRYTSTGLYVRAFNAGSESNTVVTTETGTSIEWQNPGSLAFGGTPTVFQVMMPDDMGVIDVAVTNSFVIVIPTQTDGYQGRFYWIEPGETTIDPLNFATAERSPDGIYGVQVFGDQFWLPGESTTEVWYVTGDPQAPMTRLQGIVLDRGSWQNTAVALHESMVLVDADGGVFLAQGGSPKRVSNPSIEEQVRKAISQQSKF